MQKIAPAIAAFSDDAAFRTHIFKRKKDKRAYIVGTVDCVSGQFAIRNLIRKLRRDLVFALAEYPSSVFGYSVLYGNKAIHLMRRYANLWSASLQKIIPLNWRKLIVLAIGVYRK